MQLTERQQQILDLIQPTSNEQENAELFERMKGYRFPSPLKNAARELLFPWITEEQAKEGLEANLGFRLAERFLLVGIIKNIYKQASRYGSKQSKDFSYEVLMNHIMRCVRFCGAGACGAYVSSRGIGFIMVDLPFQPRYFKPEGVLGESYILDSLKGAYPTFSNRTVYAGY